MARIPTLITAGVLLLGSLPVGASPLIAEAPAQTTPPASVSTPAPGPATAAPPASPSAPGPATPSPAAGAVRRALPQPLDSVFPVNEYQGPTIGVPKDTTVYPLMKAMGLDGDKVANGLRLYGWVDGGYSLSTSKHSNYPQIYSIAPNQLVVDQAVLSVERLPDTAQTDHTDWGFNLTTLYGIDYRWTTARGWFSNQLVQHNSFNGVDPVMAYVQYYDPKVAQGMLVTAGRYISPADIEAQLSPQNFLYTHSVFFDFDTYTNTGINAQVKLNDNWSVHVGLHTGSDTAPWDAGGHLSGQAFGRWVADDNKDSVLFGIGSLNGGQFTSGKDNLQQFNATWTHKFSDQINTMTEVYHLYSFNALVGGTVNYGPIKPFGPFGGGPGALLPGRSTAQGLVNYTNFKVDDSSYMTFRTDYMADPRGWRSGFAGSYGSLTLGYVKHVTDTLTVRPELRWERSFDQPVYDNGTRSNQWSLNADLIQRF
jgi:Putative beta-barrel porin-2, OmpL-like. bbp2